LYAGTSTRNAGRQATFASFASTPNVTVTRTATTAAMTSAIATSNTSCWRRPRRPAVAGAIADDHGRERGEHEDESRRADRRVDGLNVREVVLGRGQQRRPTYPGGRFCAQR
jgi:hypothetical protein